MVPGWLPSCFACDGEWKPPGLPVCVVTQVFSDVSMVHSAFILRVTQSISYWAAFTPFLRVNMYRLFESARGQAAHENGLLAPADRATSSFETTQNYIAAASKGIVCVCVCVCVWIPNHAVFTLLRVESWFSVICTLSKTWYWMLAVRTSCISPLAGTALPNDPKISQSELFLIKAFSTPQSS